MMPFQVDKYERLVNRILAGEVVFFVGAGFSLDSEGNSAQRLIARLIARFMAMTEELTKAGATIENLCEGLSRTFKVDKEKICSQETIEKLSARYYDINDWTTNAFETLLMAASTIPDVQQVMDQIHVRENELLQKLKLNERADPVPLELIEVATFDELARASAAKRVSSKLLASVNAKSWPGASRTPRSNR